MRIWKLIVISVVLAFGVSCADDDFDDIDDDFGDDVDDDVNATIDSTYAMDGTTATAWDSTVVYAATDPLDDPFYLAQVSGAAATDAEGVDPEVAAQAAGDAASEYFSPDSCVEAEVDDNEVTYTLTACDGPLGLAKADGTIIVTFSEPSDDQLDSAVAGDAGVGSSDGGVSNSVVAFAVTSEDLTIGDADVTLDATGTYARAATGEKVLMMSSKGKHSRNGNEVTRDLTLTAQWAAGSQCVEVDATGTLSNNGQTSDFAVDGYTRCQDDCPSNGTVRLTGDRTTTLTFDGTDEPSFETSSGVDGNIDLDCE